MSTTSEIADGLRNGVLYDDNGEILRVATKALMRVAADHLVELERENARLREMFALLPKAASEAMISAAEDAASDHFAIDGDKGAWLREDGYKAIWQAMTVAALAGSGEK
jgi:hypothetical protein